jgi:putative methionine-R-sulfoxide reductase with GAF domain
LNNTALQKGSVDMVAASDSKQESNDLERRTRNAFNIGLLITVASVLVVAGTSLLQMQTGETYYVWITAVGIVGGVLAMILARRAHVLAAAILLIAALYSVALIYVVLFENVATNLTIIMVILSLGVITQTIAAEKLGWAIGVTTAVGAGLIVLDQFWPGVRISPPPQTETIIAITGVVTILILAAIIIKQFPTFSLRGKLIGATLAVALLAVAAVAFGVNLFTTQTITTQVGLNLSSLADSQARLVGEFLAREVNTLEALSANQVLIDIAQENNARYAESSDPPSRQIAIKSGQWARAAESDEVVASVLENAASSELLKFKQFFPEHIELILADKYGAQIGATRRTRDFYKGDDVWWTDTYIGGLGSIYISEPEYRSDYGAFVLTISVPLQGKNEEGAREIIGVLTTVINLDILSNVLLDSRFGETGINEIFLPGDQHLMIDDQGELVIQATNLDPQAIEYIKQPEEPYFVTDFENTTRFLSSAFINTLTYEPVIDRLKWIVVSSQDATEILAPVNQQQRLNTILGIIVVISAGVVAAFVGQRISKPIMNLTKVAEEVTAGNFDVQAAIETQDEIGILAASFNDMTGRLRESINTLEQRVADRTQALAISAEVGRQLSTILDEDELVTAVVNQVRDAFDYYQAQIYLLADDGQTLVMAGGTGQAGQQMLAQGHKLQVGVGLVGRAAEINQVILVSDVTQDENWLPNPLLPDTKSETAVPIATGDQVIGVLDVQQNSVNGLLPEDTELLKSVANQVAVALRNARLYRTTQSQARQEALLRSINEKISSTNDMETAMKTAVRELGQALGTPQTIIRLGHHDPARSEKTANGSSISENK